MLTVEMLSEPAIVPDTFVSGLSHMEDMGDGNWRLTFYARQQSLNGGQEYVVVCRLIANTPAILDGIRTAMRSLGRRCCGAVAGRMH